MTKKEEFEQLTHNIMLSINKQFDDSELWQFIDISLKEEREKARSEGYRSALKDCKDCPLLSEEK